MPAKFSHVCGKFDSNSTSYWVWKQTMSWFLGHLFPAMAWMIVGIFIYLQSLTSVAWTAKLRFQQFWIIELISLLFIHYWLFRKQPFWLSFRAYFIIIAAYVFHLIFRLPVCDCLVTYFHRILGSAGEFIVPIIKNLPAFNWGHIIIWLGTNISP